PIAARPERRAVRLHGPVPKPPPRLDPLGMDPVHGLLLPFQRERPALEPPEIEDRAVGLRDLLDLVLGQCRRLVEARGVGQQRPDVLRRPIEMPDPGATPYASHPLVPSASGDSTRCRS